DAGVVAMLPGSRSGELRRHLPVLTAAYRELRRLRPRLRGIFGAADDAAAATIARAIEGEALQEVEVERGVSAAVARADVAWVASGTAVLETALSGVAAIAIYVIPPILIRYGLRMIRHRFITLPNLVLGREVVPELLQEQATPERLAESADALMKDPSAQYAQFLELRRALGPPDALARCARFAVELARGNAANANVSL
ncbi:MAG: hypothetical protein WA814_09765, partial [Candidatus Baltobacteraceae bacterium]